MWTVEEQVLHRRYCVSLTPDIALFYNYTSYAIGGLVGSLATYADVVTFWKYEQENNYIAQGRMVAEITGSLARAHLFILCTMSRRSVIATLGNGVGDEEVL